MSRFQDSIIGKFGKKKKNYLAIRYWLNKGFPSDTVVKNLPANARDAGNMGSILGLERSHGVGNGNPLQYSCLENPMDGEAW